MLKPNTLAQPVWAIRAAGVTRVYFLGLKGDLARINTRGIRTQWSLQSTECSPADLFHFRHEARDEYRARKAATGDRYASRNVTTTVEQPPRRRRQAQMPEGERDQLDYPHNAPGAPFQSGDY